MKPTSAVLSRLRQPDRNEDNSCCTILLLHNSCCNLRRQSPVSRDNRGLCCTQVCPRQQGKVILKVFLLLITRLSSACGDSQMIISVGANNQYQIYTCWCDSDTRRSGVTGGFNSLINHFPGLRSEEQMGFYGYINGYIGMLSATYRSMVCL